MTTLEKRAEIKTRTSSAVKSDAAAVYAHWGLTLNDAINMFLVKSIEVGGLPFDLRPELPSYDAIASVAYKAPVNKDGIPVLPADLADDDD